MKLRARVSRCSLLITTGSGLKGSLEHRDLLGRQCDPDELVEDADPLLEVTIEVFPAGVVVTRVDPYRAAALARDVTADLVDQALRGVTAERHDRQSQRLPNQASSCAVKRKEEAFFTIK